MQYVQRDHMQHDITQSTNERKKTERLTISKTLEKWNIARLIRRRNI